MLQHDKPAATGCAGGVVTVWESTGWGHGRTPWPQHALSPLTSLVPGQPAHGYVVRIRASRLHTLRRITAGLSDGVSSMRPAIWPAEYGGEHWVYAAFESCWAASASSAGGLFWDFSKAESYMFNTSIMHAGKAKQSACPCALRPTLTIVSGSFLDASPLFPFFGGRNLTCQLFLPMTAMISRFLDTQDDPLRASPWQAMLKRCILYNVTTYRVIPPEGAGSNHAWHQACIIHA